VQTDTVPQVRFTRRSTPSSGSERARGTKGNRNTDHDAEMLRGAGSEGQRFLKPDRETRPGFRMCIIRRQPLPGFATVRESRTFTRSMQGWRDPKIQMRDFQILG